MNSARKSETVVFDTKLSVYLVITKSNVWPSIRVGPDTCWHSEWFERISRKREASALSESSSPVDVKITHNQDIRGFDHVVLKEVLELTQKEANSRLVSL